MASLEVIELDDTRRELAPEDHTSSLAPEEAGRPARVQPDERRKACRYPAVVRRSETLRIGAQEILAEIVDESATGFSLSVDTNMEFSVGQKILLENQSLWLELEVVHIQKISATQTRLGVMRLRELDDSEINWQESARFCWTDVKILAAPLRMLARPVGTVGGLIVGAPFVLILLIWIFDHLAPLPLEPAETPGQYKHEA
ncbi:MAG TPA: PilZ domain-containing protein, partial [Pirellulales bacterium]|nr:PilZ domain-containing protein [Pirellulales bacterium]